MSEVEILTATDRPQQMVGRKTQMARIREAITQEGNACRIVLITGPGGLGKTRMVEEVLRRVGRTGLYGDPLPQDNWRDLLDVAHFAHVTDFADIRLQTQERFLQHLGTPSTWDNQIRFGAFGVAQNRFRRLADYGAAYTLVRSAWEEAEKVFWQDYAAAAQQRRLVIPLDTTEHLALKLKSSQWLLKHGVLKPEDLIGSTQRWLLDSIEQGRFANTTFLIAGRNAEDEGGPFFAGLEKTIGRAGVACERIDIGLAPFTVAETVAYIESLPKPTGSELTELLGPAPAERWQVLHLYTGGKPVLLALYAAILLEARVLPIPLQDAYAEARQRVDNQGLDAVRREIEAAFVDLLFQPTSTSLRPLILQALVRAPYGLVPQQLSYLLHDGAQPENQTISLEDVAGWVANDRAQTEEVKKALEGMQTLAIIRTKADGRIGLQDEIYRIYAERMVSEEKLRTVEKEARHDLYRRLKCWAEYRVTQLREENKALVAEDLRRIHIERPANILSSRMALLSPWEAQAREQLTAQLLDAELEELHYALLENPLKGLDEHYHNLMVRLSVVYTQARADVFQAEMWRVLHDTYALRFVDIPSRPVTIQRGETELTVLRRVAQQDNAVQTIIQAFLQKNYARTIQLADAVDTAVANLPNGPERHSWNHTLARAERGAWRAVAHIYTGQHIKEAVDQLAGIVRDLTQLLETDQEETAFEDRQEKGFIGHPAERRLLITLAHTYNHLGYGLVNSGRYQEAVQTYTQALRYWRQQKSTTSRTLEAHTRNNLSRALIEMGKRRALPVCYDGLALRIDDSELLPIGLSYNTLALIHNDLRQPQEALEASARALAIAQHVGDPRVVGLALLQVGEALRRVAVVRDSARSPSGAEEIFNEAERALQQAYEIFTKSEAQGEVVRHIEAALELGSLYRDWLAASNHPTPVPETILRQRQDNALNYLEEARQKSVEHGLIYLQLDALVNMAQLDFYTRPAQASGEKRFQDARKRLQEARDLVPPEALLVSVASTGAPQQAATFWSKQLSKLHLLEGEIALEEAVERVAQLKATTPNGKESERVLSEDEPLKASLQKAAEAYTLSLQYARRFALDSLLITATYDSLYHYLKGFNKTELALFYAGENHAHQAYGLNEEEGLREFLLDCFGDYYPRPNTPEGSA